MPDSKKEIHERLLTFTPAALDAARNKCVELKFDPNSGVISLDESFINLNSIKDFLIDAIEKNKLSQLSITIQNKILHELNAVSKHLTELGSGADAVVNLVNSIETLNTAIWTYGFHNLSDEVLGYETKMNQLKHWYVELEKIQRETQVALELKKSLEELIENAKKTRDGQSALSLELEQHVKTALGKFTEIEETYKNATKVLTNIQDTQTKVVDLEGMVNKSNENVTKQEKNIEALSNKSTELKTELNKQENELNELIEKTKKTHERIEHLLPGATSAQLASAFEQRRKDSYKSKLFWLCGSIVSSVVLLGIVFGYVMWEKDNMEWYRLFLRRAPITFPLIWLVWFFARNYGHAVRLEEHYAFKEATSRSFEGYKNQIKSIDSDNTLLPNFCRRTISILSESPLRIFDRKTTDEAPVKALMDEVKTKDT